MEFWDDYTCFINGHCGLAEADYQELVKSIPTTHPSTSQSPSPPSHQGIEQFIALGVPPSKLVLGLPWYAVTYRYILGVPFNQGAYSYGVLAHLLANHTSWPRPVYNATEATYVVTCDKPCVEGSPATQIWFDAPDTYRLKYALANTYGLQVREKSGDELTVI